VTGDDWGRLLYLSLLGAALLAAFLVQHRGGLGRLLRQAATWMLIFLGVIAAAALWSDVRSTRMARQTVIAAEGRIELPRAPDGHFYVTADVQGVPVRFVVDTGATDLVLTREDAARVGIDPAGLVFSGRASTANGEVRTAPVRLSEVAIGGIVQTGVRAQVNEAPMPDSLLGMSFLRRFDRIEMTRDRMVLTR
jgi:aspartyl protease family protein